jgi:hypothetical protein
MAGLNFRFTCLLALAIVPRSLLAAETVRGWSALRYAH